MNRRGADNFYAGYETENTNAEITSEDFASSDNSEEDDIELTDTIEVDFTYDYTEDIKADVDYVVSNSVSYTHLTLPTIA